MIAAPFAVCPGASILSGEGAAVVGGAAFGEIGEGFRSAAAGGGSAAGAGRGEEVVGGHLQLIPGGTAHSGPGGRERGVGDIGKRHRRGSGSDGRDGKTEEREPPNGSPFPRTDRQGCLHWILILVVDVDATGKLIQII